MNIPLIEQRAVEAAIFHALYNSLLARLPRAQALDAVADAVADLAAQAGRAFAATAPGGPSFAHFATVIDLWRASGALEVANVRQTANTLTFQVTRCDYVARYKAMGLPPELVGLLSCGRDLPFATAYSPQLTLERPDTLAAGCPACAFTFTWSTP